MPEVLRIQAAILTAQGRQDRAEVALTDSIAIARDIGALSWRLRAATDLAHLLHARSRPDDARELLIPILAAFTEGFTTGDLVDAASLIAAPSPASAGHAKPRRSTRAGRG